MNRILARARFGIVAAVLAASAVPLLTPTPAAAWWRRGWGYGWHPGWGYGWRRGCCWGPGVVVGAPPVVYAPPPVVVGRVWIRPHWNGPYWVPGHWG